MLSVLVMVLILTWGPRTAKANPTPASPAPITMQAVPQLLASIEEKLRTLSESINSGQSNSNTRSGSRIWGEGGVEVLARRLEAVETRLGRLDTLIELRLDKLSETVGGRQMKDELAIEQLGRKLDATAERLNHRLGYLEARLDVASAKITARLDAMQRTTNAEHSPTHTCCHQLQMTVGASESRLRSQIERLGENVRGTQQISSQSDSSGVRWDTNEHAQNLSRALKDVLKSSRDKMLESLDMETKNIGIKVTGMCSDLWRRTQGIEELVKQNVAVSNVTQRQMQEILRNLGRTRHETMSTAPASAELEEIGNRLQRRMTDLGRRLDSSFQMMMLGQNMFLESCHRIQLGEPQLEAQLSLVLERMLDTITNKSIGVTNDLLNIRESIQTHSTQTSRSLSSLRNIIMQSSEQSVSDSKNIASAIKHLGGLTEQRLTQLHSHTPTAEAVANLIVQDLKPMLLRIPDIRSTPLTFINETEIKPFHKNTSIISTIPVLKNKTTKAKDEHNKDIVSEDSEDLDDFETSEPDTEIASPSDNVLFANIHDKDFDPERLWQSMGDNVSLADILQSMMSKDMSSSSLLKLEEDGGNSTEDYTILSEPE